jgi:hypothetical protein
MESDMITKGDTRRICLEQIILQQKQGPVLPEHIQEMTGLETNLIWNALRWLRAKGLATNPGRRARRGWNALVDSPPRDYCWDHGITKVKTKLGGTCPRCHHGY